MRDTHPARELPQALEPEQTDPDGRATFAHAPPGALDVLAFDGDVRNGYEAQEALRTVARTGARIAVLGPVPASDDDVVVGLGTR